MPVSVCILTAYSSIVSMSVPSTRALAETHTYVVRFVERNDCMLRAGWIKIEPIRQALEGGFDFVLWLDAETYVARKDIDIPNIVRPEIHLRMAWHTPARTSSTWTRYSQ